MKSRHLTFLAVAFTFFSCGTKKLNVSFFDMEIPSGWSYEPGNGTDSFVGTITTSSNNITFDYSTKGYASSLILTEQQYLADQTNWALSACYFCDPDVTYVAPEMVEAEKARLMAKVQAAGAPPIRVEPNIEYTRHIRVPDAEWRRYYPGADYIADLKYKDSTIYVPIRIPQSIKKHHIKVDTVDNYIIKTIWPLTPGDGTTGIYIKSRISPLNFNMQGVDLSASEQDKALEAFKTIKLKQ